MMASFSLNGVPLTNAEDRLFPKKFYCYVPGYSLTEPHLCVRSLDDEAFSFLKLCVCHIFIPSCEIAPNDASLSFSYLMLDYQCM